MKRISSSDLRALRDKYERMFALRAAHERARSDASFVEPDPREDMARLAEDYPGALREIDVLPLELIAARIQALVTAERDPSRVETWMVAQTAFHCHARGALVAKRWLAGRKTITPAVRAAFAEALRGLPRGADAELFANELEAVASPPRGRLMVLVHAKVARALAMTEAEARMLVFGAPRRTGAPRGR